LEVKVSLKDDPIIKRIREARHQISEQHGHDPQKLVSYYIKLQEQYKERLLVGDEEETNRAETVQS
jgi:cell fate (sporulation/competence/biofilm development) regulator YlbF (YheA/YmcA/DUF963 family)